MRRFRALFIFCLSLLVLAAASFVLSHFATARAATPASGTLSLTGAPVQWDGFALPGASPAGEDSCVEGVNCDTFTLTLAPGDYTGKRARFRVTWTNQFNDYDVVVHAGSNDGPEVQSAGDGAPETLEENTWDIDTVVTAGVNDVFTIRTVYFAVATLDPYHGVVSLEDISTGGLRTATYIIDKKAGIAFSRNRTVFATSAGQDVEPSARVDFQGNAYVGGIRGLTGGNDLWRFDLNPLSPTFDPFLRVASAVFDNNGNVSNPAWLGQPDAFAPDDDSDLGGDGGGDLDVAVGFMAAQGQPPILATSSLTAANVSSQRSTDRGDNWLRNPAGNTTIPVDDRQWNEFLGGSAVYLVYREFTGLQATSKFYINRSDDGGLTYGPAVLAALGGNTTGNIDVDQHDGTVYFCHQGPGTSGNKQVRVAVGQPPSLLVPPVTYTTSVAATGNNSIAFLFPVCKVADDGTVYVAYSDGGAGIFVTHSFDHGRTWAAPVRVDKLPTGSAVLFPWIETGQRPGSIAVVWYGAPTELAEDGVGGVTNNNSNWHVYYSMSLNATSSSPTFRQVQASDHIIHASNISVLGFQTSGPPQNRNLADFFQVAVDPQGLALIAFADDSNDFRGHTYVTHQVEGISLNTGKRIALKDKGSDPVPAAGDPQVKDWRHDARLESRPPILPDVDTPGDIISIQYSCEQGPLMNTLIKATMRASGLDTAPPDGIWRIVFASNPTKPGVSDRADQWFVVAETDTTGVRTFSYGTAARNTDGSTTFTKVGPADFGQFDFVNRSVTLKVDMAKLNALQTRGVITDKTRFIGLRGSASINNFSIAGLAGTGLTDATRGGTSFSCR